MYGGESCGQHSLPSSGNVFRPRPLTKEYLENASGTPADAGKGISADPMNGLFSRKSSCSGFFLTKRKRKKPRCTACLDVRSSKCRLSFANSCRFDQIMDFFEILRGFGEPQGNMHVGGNCGQQPFPSSEDVFRPGSLKISILEKVCKLEVNASRTKKA